MKTLELQESPAHKRNSVWGWTQRPIDDNAAKYVRCPNCRYSFVCRESSAKHKCADIIADLVKLPTHHTIPDNATESHSCVSEMRDNSVMRERSRLPPLKTSFGQTIETSNITSLSTVFGGGSFHQEQRDYSQQNGSSQVLKLPPIELNNRITKNIILDQSAKQSSENTIMTYDYQQEQETRQPDTERLKLPDIRETNGWGRHFNHYSHWNQGNSQPPSEDKDVDSHTDNDCSEDSFSTTTATPPQINLRQIYMDRHRERYQHMDADRLPVANRKRLPLRALPAPPSNTEPCEMNEQILSRLGLQYLPSKNNINNFNNSNNNNIKNNSNNSNSYDDGECALPKIQVPVPPVKKFVVTKPRMLYRDPSPAMKKLQQQMKQQQQEIHLKTPEEMLRFKALVDIMKKAVKKMESSYWDESIVGLQETVKVADVDPAAVEPFIKHVNRAQIKMLRSLRSAVVREACAATKELFRSMRCTLRPEFDEIANLLIQKTADLNLCIRRDANDALDSMVTFLAPFNCVRVITKAVGHRNPLVRSAVARLITCVVVIMSPDVLLGPRGNREVRKMIMCMIAQLINDQCFVTKKQTRDLYKILMTHEDFEAIFQQDIDIAVYEKLEQSLLQLKYQIQQSET